MHLVTCRYFRSRNKGGDHAIRSAVAENSILHANFAVLCVIEADLLAVEFSHHGEAVYVLSRSFTLVVSK